MAGIDPDELDDDRIVRLNQRSIVDVEGHRFGENQVVDMRYLALSNLIDVETCEYPDSQKLLVVTGQRGKRGLRKMFRAENAWP